MRKGGENPNGSSEEGSSEEGSAKEGSAKEGGERVLISISGITGLNEERG